VEECKRRELAPDGANQRSVLGKALSLIRFPLMTAQEFANGPAKSGLLTEQEKIDLFIYYASHPKPSTRFISEPRVYFVVLKLFSEVVDVRTMYSHNNASPDEI